MRMVLNSVRRFVLLLGAVVAVLLVSCSKPELEIEVEKVPFPYKVLPATEENPAEYGPGDETVLGAIDGKMGDVPFRHYTHSSNGKGGYGIDCLVCHHDAETADDAAGCKDCHDQGEEPEAALLGPDNNVRIELEHRTITPVMFNHFAHASFEQGYKIGCNRCHHIEGDYSPCSDCHQSVATRQEGKVVPKIKRALHLHCRNCHILSGVKNAPTTCKGCHSPARHEKPTDMVALSRSYHVQCINCHQLVNASADKEAPTTCDGCHKPNKK